MADQRTVFPHEPDGRHTGYVETNIDTDGDAPHTKVLGLGRSPRAYVLFAAVVALAIIAMWATFSGGGGDADMADEPAAVTAPAGSDTMAPAADN